MSRAGSSFNGFGSMAKNAELHACSIAKQHAAEQSEVARLQRLIGDLRTSLLATIPYVTGQNAVTDTIRKSAARVLAQTAESQTA